MLSLEPDVFGHDSLRIQKELYIHQQDPVEYACSATDTSSSETNTTSPEESSPPKKPIKPRKKIAKRNTGLIATSHSESIEQSRFAPLLQMTLKQFETYVTKHRLLSKRDATSNVEGDE